MNTIVGYVYDMLYGDSGGFPSYASAAAILLFVIVLTITCINLLVSKNMCITERQTVMDKELDYGQTEERDRKKPELARQEPIFFCRSGRSWCCFRFTGCF